MKEQYNYNELLNLAFEKIRDIREPTATDQTDVRYNKREIDNEKIISMGGINFESAETTILSAQDISEKCIDHIISELCKYYGVSLHKLRLDVLRAKMASTLTKNSLLPKEAESLSESVKNFEWMWNSIRFAYYDINESCVLLFKRPERSLMWMVRSEPNEYIKTVIEDLGATKYRFIYLMYDKAEKQIFGGNTTDEIFCSMRWFFCKYYGEEEYKQFRIFFENFNRIVNEYLGFSIVKTLNPAARANFRRVVCYRIFYFDYSSLCDMKINGRELERESYDIIKEQYIENYLYFIMVGNRDFSESLVTAEWLYDSMRDAKAIDLTAVGMGFLKSVEQLLYRIVLLHQGDNLKIKGKNTKEYVRLNAQSVEGDCIDTSIGSMANFLKNNYGIMRNELPYSARKYVVEAVFMFKDIRNTFFHKRNICNWETINMMRRVTYCLMFLLLGSMTFSKEDLRELGFPDDYFFTDRYRLCEYVNYHAGDLFYLCDDKERETLVVADRDLEVKLNEGIYYTYSGVYFGGLGQKRKNYLNRLPKEIYLADLGIQDIETIKFEPRKIMKVFSHGKFLGPSIIEEEGANY